MTTRGTGLLVLAGLGYLFARNVGGPFPSLLFYATSATLLLAWIWSAALAGGLSASLRLQGRAFTVGETAEWILEVKNRTPLPAVFHVHTIASEPCSEVVSFGDASAWGVAPRQHRTFRRRVRLARRGRFRPCSVSLRFGDPVDLFAFTRLLNGGEPISVYPRPICVQDLPLYGRFDGSKHAARRSGRPKSGEIRSVRPFGPGDSLRYIHWKVSARRGALFVKEFEPESEENRPMLILPDLSPSVQAGSAGHDTVEFTVSLVWGLAQYGCSRGLPVGLFCSGPRPVRILPALGPRQERLLRESLLDIQAESPRPFPPWLLAESVRFPARSRLCLISPYVHPALVNVIDRLRRAGHAPILFSLQVETFDPARPPEPNREACLEQLQRLQVPCLSLSAGQQVVGGWDR